MKKLLGTMVLLVIFTLAAQTARAATARLQVIHNAPDPAAEEVDVYVNGDLTLNDFAFRTATPFLEVPANVELSIGVAPGNSVSESDILASFPVTLEANRSYVAVAGGVLDPSQFAANPDGKAVSFSIYPRQARTDARWHILTDLLVFHGSPDAPAVDVRLQNWPYGPLVRDIAYGTFSRYTSVFPLKYTLDITPAGDRSTVVASFTADLTGLRGGAAVVFASGFLDPSANINGPAFGLFAVLPTGDVIELPKDMEMARLQVIHNAADPAAQSVDIYINNELKLDDFEFRSATPFIDVPANVELSIGIAPATSASPADIIASIPVMFEADKTYAAVANGVLDPTSFAANPDGRSIGLELFARDGMREKANEWHKVDVRILHGSTDAPAVDVIARNVSTTPIVSGAAYGDFTGYLSLPADKYILDITPAGLNETVVATYEADLSMLRGGAALVFASGFLDPAANMNGEAFGLFAALPNGDVVEFPAYLGATARLQVIHNAADPAADVVDLYVNGEPFYDNFAFRTATPYIDVPAGVELSIGVAPGNSSSSADIIASIPVWLEAEKTYVAIANGVLDPDAFADNPNRRSIGFDLFARDGMRESSPLGYLANIIVFHGASDAPEVDIYAKRYWRWKIVGEAGYGDFSPYRYLWPRKYELQVTPAGERYNVLASFEADLSGLRGGTATVFASGFLSPEDNQNGAAFGLFAALSDGTVLELPMKGGMAIVDAGKTLDDAALPAQFALNQNYPNPFNPTTTISFSLPEATDVQLKVYNVLGQEVETLVDEYKDAGEYQVEFNAGAVASGIYFYRLQTDNNVESKKMVLLK